MSKSYVGLSRLKSFDDRYDYLRLAGVVGEPTFGYSRWMNQALYHSSLWRDIRDEVIIRDNGCDLGMLDYEIGDRIYVHHIVPITLNDVRRLSVCVFDLNNLICTSYDTHQAIHFGNKSSLPQIPVIRNLGDTTLWRKETHG